MIIGYLEETDLAAIKLNNNWWSDSQRTYNNSMFIKNQQELYMATYVLRKSKID
jgi:hypothetical protein